MFFKIGARPATLLKRDSNTGVSYEIYEIFKVNKSVYITSHTN